MARRFAAVGEARSRRALELLAELAELAPRLDPVECLEAIGEVAKLGAVLAARHGAAAAPPAKAAEDGLLNAGAAARRLSLPLSSVYRLVREEQLRAVRIAEGTLRFDPADLAEFVEARKTVRG